MNKRICGNCKYFTQDDGCTVCGLDGEQQAIADDGCDYFVAAKKPTNRDLINAMSDEELADEFFSVANKRTGKNGYCRIYWQNPKPCRPWLKCNKCLLDWLKAQAGEHQEVG